MCGREPIISAALRRGMATSRDLRPERPNGRRPLPSEVVPGLFVGGWKESLGFEGRRICVRDDGDEPSDPTDLHVPVYDGAAQRPNRENLDRVADAIDQARSAGRPVLVYCGFGQRRSPLAVAWYLHRHEGWDLEEAYARVRSVRPGVEHFREWVGDPAPLAATSEPSRRRSSREPPGPRRTRT